MIQGVIDIGTNTVRSVIYNEALKKENELVFESQILNHTCDGILSEEGIFALADNIKKSVKFFRDNGTDKMSCFATSAMRDVVNFGVVNKRINELCGINIELLDEKEEAFCDFLSLKIQLGEDCTGAGIDLGGGSCQIMTFAKGELVSFCSEKLGVKRLYNRFGELTPEKEAEVRGFIKEKISVDDGVRSRTLYVMGGTSKKIRKLAVKLLGKDRILRSDLSAILEKYYQKDTEYIHLSATEVHKIPFGIIVVDEICGLFNSEEIAVMDGGVREGYIASRKK